MYHLIEFNTAFAADLEASPRQRLERLRFRKGTRAHVSLRHLRRVRDQDCDHIRKGTRAHVSLRPYVMETAGEFDEVADLFFEDGTVTRQVPFAWFRFVE